MKRILIASLAVGAALLTVRDASAWFQFNNGINWNVGLGWGGGPCERGFCKPAPPHTVINNYPAIIDNGMSFGSEVPPPVDFAPPPPYGVAPNGYAPPPPYGAAPNGYAPPPPYGAAPNGYAPPPNAPPPGYAPPAQNAPAPNGYAPAQNAPAPGGYAPPAQNAPAPGGYAPPAQNTPVSGSYAPPVQNAPPAGGYAPPVQNAPAPGGYAGPIQSEPITGHFPSIGNPLDSALFSPSGPVNRLGQLLFGQQLLGQPHGFPYEGTDQQMPYGAVGDPNAIPTNYATPDYWNNR